MELRASGEDYLEAVLILGQRMKQVRAIDVAQYLGYAKTSVSHGLRLLRQGGLLTRDADGYLYLTEVGRETAEKRALPPTPPRKTPAAWNTLSVREVFVS